MYLYELHMHSREGSACAQNSIHEMIRKYVDLGFSGGVITNHFIGGNTSVDRNLPWAELIDQYSCAYFEGQETAEKLGFHLLFGVEEGYGGGKEFLAYGIEPEFLKENPQLRFGGVAAWSAALHSVGGFLAYAHPFRVRDYISDPYAMPDLSLADGIEVYNRGNRPEDNQKAVDVFGNSDMVLIAGTDSHRITISGAYGVALPCEVTTGTELAAALKQKNFTIWLGNP